MKSPQKENGYTPIANELIEALAKIRISGQAIQLLWTIFRKTYGWNKKSDQIALIQFQRATNLSKVAICKNLNYLLKMNIITKKGNAKALFTHIGNDKAITYSICKDYSKWRPLPKKVTMTNITNMGNANITNNGNLTLPIMDTTKDTITKTTITKVNCAGSNEPVAFSIPKPPREYPTPGRPESEYNALDLIGYFGNRFKQVTEYIYPANFGKDGKIFKDLLKIYDALLILDLLDIFFESAQKDDAWAKDKLSIGIFQTQLPSILIKKREEKRKDDRIDEI